MAKKSERSKAKNPGNNSPAKMGLMAENPSELRPKIGKIAFNSWKFKLTRKFDSKAKSKWNNDRKFWKFESNGWNPFIFILKSFRWPQFSFVIGFFKLTVRFGYLVWNNRKKILLSLSLIHHGIHFLFSRQNFLIAPDFRKFLKKSGGDPDSEFRKKEQN